MTELESVLFEIGTTVFGIGGNVVAGDSVPPPPIPRIVYTLLLIAPSFESTSFSLWVSHWDRIFIKYRHFVLFIAEVAPSQSNNALSPSRLIQKNILPTKEVEIYLHEPTKWKLNT